MAGNRFLKDKNKEKSIFFSVVISALCIVIFVMEINTVQKTAQTKQKESLENAIIRNVVHCYSTQGSYPQDIQYLKDHYGLSYDEEKYFVSYNIFASNIMPDITVIERQN